MKSYEFLCGGDYGAWECLVDVELTDEEEAVLKEYAKDDRNEHLSGFPPTDGIWSKVIDALEEQCDDELNVDTVVVWVPYELRE